MLGSAQLDGLTERRDDATPAARDDLAASRRSHVGHGQELQEGPTCRHASGSSSRETLAKLGEHLPQARLRLRLAQPRFRVPAPPRPASCRWTSSSTTAGNNDWEMDVAWVVKGGQIRSSGSRSTAAASTPCTSRTSRRLARTTDEDGWADVGHGTHGLAGARDRPSRAHTNARYWVMEHDTRPRRRRPLRVPLRRRRHPAWQPDQEPLMTDFSFQLYSARNFPPLADILKMVAAAGYKQVEGYGALYADAAKVAELKAHLGASGLKMPTGHFGLDHARERARPRARDRQGARHRDDLLPLPRRPTSARHRRRLASTSASGCRRPASRYRDAGLGFGWHNHDFEFKQLPDGSLPQVAIFEGGPDLEWEADIAWVIRGGADPLEWIKTFGNRITAVHVKDIAPAGENADEDGWADVGHGTVDWKALMAGAHGHPGQVLRHGARQPQGRQALRRALDRRRQASSEEPTMTDTARHRHHRLRQHLRRLLPPRAAVQGPRGARLRRHQPGRRRGARQGVRRQGPDHRRAARQPRRSTSSST